MDGTATISLDTLDELREKAEEARLATNRSKKFTSKLMDCYEFDTEKYNKVLEEIDNKEDLTDKQCSKLIREAMVKHLKMFHRERTDSGSVRYAEQQISMDITTAISADRDWDGKIHYKIRKGNKNVRSVHKKPKEKLLVQIWRELYMHKLR